MRGVRIDWIHALVSPKRQRGRTSIPRWRVGLTALLVLGFGCPLALAQPKGALDPAQPYQAERGEPVTHTVDFSVVVTPPYLCKVLKVWLPVPQSDLAQEVVAASEFSTFPNKVVAQVNTEPVYGNRFAYFEFKNPQGAQIIKHKFKVKLWELHWNLKPAKVHSVKDWPKEFAPYLKPHEVSDKKGFANLLKTLAPTPSNPAADLAAVMDWIDKHMTYSHDNASLKADADHAFSKKAGHCSDYHGLCAAVGRALGYPTRLTYGLTLIPRNSPSHCRVEAFLPPYGWVSFDLSETQQMIKRINEDAKLDKDTRDQLSKAARARLLGGFRENSWLLLTKGAGYQLAPPAVAPVPVIRTAYVEADGEVLPDPDPANSKQRQFAWMTVHHYQADRPFTLPFQDYSTLKLKSSP